MPYTSVPHNLVIVEGGNGGCDSTGVVNNVTHEDITRILGVKPLTGLGQHSKYEWEFTINGDSCAIWDHRGSYLKRKFSTFGKSEYFKAIFGTYYQSFVVDE